MDMVPDEHWYLRFISLSSLGVLFWALPAFLAVLPGVLGGMLTRERPFREIRPFFLLLFSVSLSLPWLLYATLSL